MPNIEANGIEKTPRDERLAVVVRDATASDAHALARLCTQLGYPTEPGALPHRLAEMKADNNVNVFVAERGGEVIGLATVHLRIALNHAHPLAQLTLLVVDEAQRGFGVGRALVDRVERFARERGSVRLVVTTALQRTGAHAFYERLAYRHTGRRYLKDFD